LGALDDSLVVVVVFMPHPPVRILIWNSINLGGVPLPGKIKEEEEEEEEKHLAATLIMGVTAPNRGFPQLM
jgi:hypothetical protein